MLQEGDAGTLEAASRPGLSVVGKFPVCFVVDQEELNDDLRSVPYLESTSLRN